MIRTPRGPRDRVDTHGRRAMSTTPDVEGFLPLRAAHFHVLLSLTDGPTHGYAVKREVEARTNGTIRLAAGSLYESLQRLERQGLIEEADTPADPSARTSSRQRFYAMTPLGRSVLRAELNRLEADLAVARARIG